MQYLTVDLAYKISIFMLLLSSLISALELIRIPKLFIDFVFPRTNLKDKYTNWLIIHIIQAILVLLTFYCFINNYVGWFKICFVLLTAITLYSYRQRKTGKDGSDQLRILTLLSYSLCFLLDDENRQLVSIYFTGMQIVIGYTTSGTVKLLSKYWRKGDVLSGVLSTYSYGVPRVSIFLKNNPLVEKTVSHSAIMIMLAVPITFLLPYQAPLLIVLGLALCFHISTAILMGLNDFLYTFPVGYPGVILLHSLIFQ
jgi:hypothetical protein